MAMKLPQLRAERDQHECGVAEASMRAYLTRRAVWKISSSWRARAAASSGGGFVQVPRSFNLRSMSAMYYRHRVRDDTEIGTTILTLWFLLKITSNADAAGCTRVRRSSANESGHNRPAPASLSRTMSCWCWLWPYKIDRSKYDDVSYCSWSCR